MKFRTALSLACLLLSSVLAVRVDAAPDDRFLAARDAVKAGDKAKLERIAPELQGYELEAYVDYWRLGVDLGNADPAVIKAFLQRNDKTYIADKLRGDWLRQLGKRQQWADFDAEFPALVQPDQELACYALQSRRLRGDASMLDEAQPLWLNLIEPPEGCYPVLEALILEKRVLADDVWARVRRQFEANRLAAARYSMNYLPSSQTPDAKLAVAVGDAPMPWLARLSTSALNQRMNRELVALAISRIARNDPRMAAEQLERFEKHLHPGERGWAWGQIGWQAAQKHMDEALGWFRKAGDAPLSEEVSQWKVRAALRAQDWGTVRAAIEAMPTALASQPAWVYWLGRAYRAGGRVEDANALFARISGQPNFYGNLADDELGRAITVPPKANPPTRDEMARVGELSGIRRGLALLRLNMRVEGVREWSWGLRGLNDRELLAAAEIARRADVYDRAIAAADRTKNEHDYSLRYLSPFSEQVRPAARNQSLDDAWVYGLMRQESRFVTNARSTVGASGLMQLMPATARWVAKKIGLADYHHGKVNDTETNVLLGTSYMRLVMEDLDNHPVLASAAYNAGPGRARKWRADRPLEGAVYAETIPFNETRDYVKKVMSNAVYYSALFENRPQSIKSRLGTVSPRVNGDAKNPDLP
ncbi:transglycosylase SLT domain-containing protein [uncultured Propionivibrio sp.]|uniref:lytic transglycosylase domain-containing protein n=1 Tax=uncultured Propionivibrio sp. TaxID=426737 RepID=UPI0029C0CA3D|nr:transglycosylase SLT domain-containing protein [uncultured Propionivibrio sp.]